MTATGSQEDAARRLGLGASELMFLFPKKGGALGLVAWVGWKTCCFIDLHWQLLAGLAGWSVRWFVGLAIEKGLQHVAAVFRATDGVAPKWVVTFCRTRNSNIPINHYN